MVAPRFAAKGAGRKLHTHRSSSCSRTACAASSASARVSPLRVLPSCACVSLGLRPGTEASEVLIASAARRHAPRRSLQDRSGGRVIPARTSRPSCTGAKKYHAGTTTAPSGAGCHAMQAMAGRNVLSAGLRAAATAQRRPQRPAAGLASATARAPGASGARQHAVLRGGSSARRGRPLHASRERAGASTAQPLEQYAGRYGTWTLTEDDRREVWAYRTCLAVVAAGALLGLLAVQRGQTAACRNLAGAPC